MSGSSAVRWGAALTAVAAAASLAVAPAAGATGAATRPPTAPAVDVATVSPAAVPYTRITLIVYGCNGCTIGVQRALKPGSTVRPSRPTYWGGVRTVVRNGAATLRMPTAWTPGASFTINAPWMGEFGFMPNVVARYYRYAPRSSVTASQAAAAKAATACWAGTNRSRATIVIRVAKAGPATDMNGQRRYLPRAWAYPSLYTAGNSWQATSRGIIGTQDAFYC